MSKDEKNPLVCDECGHESGAAFTARAHAKTHEEGVQSRVVEEKPKRTRKKAAK